MPGFFRPSCRAALVPALAAGLFAAGPAPARAQPDDSASPRTVINMNARSYLWLLPQFWMAGDESYGYIRIENTLDRPISIYVHCHTADGTIGRMSGRHSLRPREVIVVDSRQHRSGTGGAVLVRCSLKSQDLATVRYMIRDSRIKNYGDFPILVRPVTG